MILSHVYLSANPKNPADPITRNVEGMKNEEAVKAVMDAWDQAVSTRAPELKILFGPGKSGTQMKRKIQKSIEDQ